MEFGRRPSWSMEFSRRPSWTLDVSPNSMAAIEDASKMAEKLRKRRVTISKSISSIASSNGADAASPKSAGQDLDFVGGYSSETGSDTPSKIDNAFGTSEKSGMSAFKDATEALEKLLLQKSSVLETKLDTVISRMDACFGKNTAEFNQIISGVWQLKSSVNYFQHDDPGPPLTQEGPDQPANLSGFKAKRAGAAIARGHKLSPKFIRPPKPPSFTPRTPRSPRNSEENIEPINVSPRLPDIPSSRFHVIGNDTENGVQKPQLTRKDSKLSLSSKHSKHSKHSAFSSRGSSGASAHRFLLLSRARNRSKIAQMAWLLLEDPRLIPGGQAYVRVLMLIIITSCCFNILQTVESPPLSALAESVLDYTVDCILSAEIFVRFLVCPNRITFWTHRLNLLDVFVGPLTLIVRIMLPLLFPGDAFTDSTANMLLKSWLPVGQLLRLIRRFGSSYLIYTAFKNASEALPMLLYVLLLIIVSFASILYLIEPRDNIGSLPEALWFITVTIGTVGYGDVTPDTAGGKVVIVVLIIVSALYMAIPLGIVGQVFSEVWVDRKRLMLTQFARQRFQCLGYTAKDIPAMFLSADVDKDGLLCLEEFTNMMKHFQFDTSGERAAELFEVFDTDGGGSIDDREFLQTLYPDVVTKIYGEDDGDDFNPSGSQRS